MDLIFIALGALFVLAATGLAQACRRLEVRGARP